MTSPEATGSARYNPGNWVAIASPMSWLLADLDPHSPVVARCYDLIVSGAPPEDILDAIVSMGLRAVPSFAFVSAARGTLLLRGSARASVLNADGTSRDFDSTSATTWAEHRLVSEPAAFRLIGGAVGDASVELPLSDGVTMASSVTIHTHSQAGRQALHNDAPIGIQPGAGAQQPAAAQPVVDTLSPEETGRARVDTGGGPLIDSLPWAQKPMMPPPRQPPPTYPPHERPVFNPPPPPQPYYDPPRQPPPAQPPAPQQPLAAPPPAPQRPLAAQPPAPQQPTASVAPAAEGDAGPEATMGRSLLRALIAAQDPVPIQGPTVHAVHCPNGHLNPAHASSCRVCGAHVLDEAPITVPRPVLGALRLSTGDVIPLDRGVLLGRNPKGGSAGPDADRHVVRVPSPTGDISRAHTEIRLDGWHVLVVDLNSTNGTVVVLPGRAPERLRPNEPRPIEPGTVVVLSDEVSFRFEVEQ
jgi:hypothetical protein